MESMPDIDLSIHDIENQQKIILRNLQLLSDNPELNQLLDKTGYNIPRRNISPVRVREHLSQAVIPANCSSFVMSSNLDSLADAIGRRCPGSVTRGHPSSNSRLNNTDSNASNGSHAYVGSSSNVGGGSTKQVDIQRLAYRQPKSNGCSHDNSAQSSVPNKGSKYTKDLMLSDNP